MSVDCILNPINYSFSSDLLANFLWNALMSSLACNDRASFMLSFLVLRKLFVLTFSPTRHDPRTSKLKIFSHVSLVREIIGKRVVYDSFPDTISKEFLRILSERTAQSHIDLIQRISSYPNFGEHDVCKSAIRAWYDHYEVVVVPFGRTIILIM